jgi:hypothetical protein
MYPHIWRGNKRWKSPESRHLLPMNCQENGQKGYATLAATTAIYVNDALTLLTTINLCDDALTPRNYFYPRLL